MYKIFAYIELRELPRPDWRVVEGGKNSTGPKLAVQEAARNQPEVGDERQNYDIRKHSSCCSTSNLMYRSKSNSKNMGRDSISWQSTG